MRKIFAQFHTDDFAEGAFGGEQQRTPFSRANINKTERLNAAPRGERTHPAAAHLAKHRRRDGGIAGEVFVMRMAGHEIALAQISGGVEAVANVKRMRDVVGRQNGTYGGARSHHTRPRMTIAGLQHSTFISISQSHKKIFRPKTGVSMS